MGKGEKNGGDNKVAPAVEKEDDVSVIAVYKIDLHCGRCAKIVKRTVSQKTRFTKLRNPGSAFPVGVEELKTDYDANKLTVKGTNVYPTAIREKLEEIIKKKVELVSPWPKKDSGGGDKKPEEKKAEKKEETKPAFGLR